MDKVVLGAWANAGQVCIKIQRLFVHASVFDRFVEEFVARTKKVACGDPLDPEVMVGPIIDAGHAERILTWVEEAVQAGAKLHCGGTAEGNVVAPTVLTSVSSDMRVDRDEVFGPVTVVHPFEDFDEAIAACNAGRYGLQAGVFTPDMGRALRAYRELDYGGVMIGEIPTFRVDNFPYGGSKDSGFGREGVRYAMEEMTEPKVLVISA
jgi:acyl-CoA reductase-like NAD-dependent aldehyde dehydrogenase